ncbi:MAG TPA: aminopeptidase [Thermoanaerobaculia bacterium]
MNEKHLQRYAEILVEHGAGLRAGQTLFIHAETAHRELVRRIAEAAYDRDAGLVRFWINDPLLQGQLIRRGRLEDVELSRAREQQWYDDVVRARGAVVSLRGDEYPDLQQELAKTHPEQHAAFTRATTAVPRVFHLHGINRGLCPWVVAGAPCVGWAKQVFPGVDGDLALDRLAELVFGFTHADRDDAVELAAAKDRLLHARRRELDALAIRELHVVGPGTDLRLGLSAKARWLGGSKQTAAGQTFNANVPSEENFTTPDRRATAGRVRATMPFRLKNGVLVKDLEMTFENGRLTWFDAGEGKEGFGRWIDLDEGARHLGEIALVAQDSPIAASGIFFEHTLFDENASAHLALGKAYATALAGGEAMTGGELAALGVNESAIHTDIMFGSSEVTIVATRSVEGEVVLIENGRWTERFLEAG